MRNALCKYFLLLATLISQSFLAQNAYVLDDANMHKSEADLLPFTWMAEISKGESVKVLPLLQDLPINKSYHFYFLVANNTKDTATRVIQFGGLYVTASCFSLYMPVSKTRKHFSSRTNKTTLSIAPNETAILVFKMSELNRADPKRLSVNLLTPGAFLQKKQSTQSKQSFFLGLFLFLFVFNMIVHFVTGWRVYLKYSIYILSALLYFSYYFGLIQEVIPQTNNLSTNIAYTWYSLVFITYFYFLNDFGDYKKYVPNAHKLLNVGIGFKITESVVNTFLHFAGFNFIYSKTYVNTVLGLEIVLMGFIIFYILKNKNLRGRLVVLASFMLILMAIIEQTQILPDLDSAYFVEAGIVAELLTFSVGLGYVTKLYYDEKRNAELLYVQQLVANERLQKDTNDKLEILVQKRTDELNAEKKLVEKKNAENELLLTEIHHRVKNNLQVISSLLSLQENSITNGNAKNAIKEGKNRIKSMELVHKMLYRADSFSGIEMKDYVIKLSEGLIESFGKIGQSEVQAKFHSITVNVDTAISLGLILNELIVNSLKHGKPANGKLRVVVEITNREKELFVKVADNGNGKLAALQASDSSGMRIIKALVRQLNGELDISEKEGLSYIILLKNTINLHEN